MAVMTAVLGPRYYENGRQLAVPWLYLIKIRHKKGNTNENKGSLDV